MLSHIDFGHLSNVWFISLPIIIVAIIIVGTIKKNRLLLKMHFSLEDPFRYLRWSLLILGLSLITIAMLGPRQEVGVREIQGEGLDIYLLVDTSKSMLGTDVTPSRLDRSKKIIEELMTKLSGDRIGLIPYASSAYIQMPLTDDYALASMFLNVIDTDMIGGGGTDLAQAISLGIDSFGTTGSTNQVIVLLSDGEENDLEMKQIEKLLKDSDVKIFSIGIGSLEGSLIPIYDDDGVTVKDYKKDQNGDLVMSRLDEENLAQVARMTGGNYYKSTASISEVSNLVEDLSQLDTAETTTRKIKEYQQLFQWFLGLGLISLIISLKLPERRKTI